MEKRRKAVRNKKHTDSLESAYAIQGDGVAVLQPGRLREDREFVEKIRKMRGYDILEKVATGNN
ncbi:hypothetical protein [Isoalcanivorax indicus]|uniref:hypothetical protein n=1 Tax=Isoalcanivorax indicus TaxID=2202653 RepID=UPI0013C45D70|nr:hypothetical protein [Isoalcanivorax indicus]